MRGDQLTLSAVLARLEEREREITAQADAAKERIAELSAQLEEFHRTAEEIRITRKTLPRELPGFIRSASGFSPVVKRI
jgi:prefoldin subunit 5